ncbi:MAG: enoyl reductase-like protein/acyl dehydratase, partial [Myxococcota bacterium]
MSVETPLHDTHETRGQSLLEAILAGDKRVVLSFAGQGAGCLPELATLYREVPACRPWVDAADVALRQLAEQRAWRWTGSYDQGFELLRWIHDEDARPDATYMTSSAISQPLILLTQMARYAWLYELGLGAAFAHGDGGGVVATTGHSQGALSALLVAESEDGVVDTARLVEFVRYLAWQGHHMANVWREAGAAATEVEGATPMAAVGGVDLPRLLAEAKRVNTTLPESAHLVIALRNTRNRHVASGPPATLERLRQHLEAIHTRETEARKKGQFGGSPIQVSWDYLEVDAAFHSPFMTPVLARMHASMDVEGFSIPTDGLNLPAFTSVDGTRFNDATDLRDAVIRLNAVEPMRWAQTLDAAVDAVRPDYVLDLGPGVGVARLTSSSLRGSGVGVLALSEPSGRAALLDEGAAPTVLDYGVFAPTLVTLPDGTVVLENHYTRATGMSPIILPGMTPTTVDAPIVANAANAGFTAELAGGGQVTEPMFALRLEELSALLKPGRQVVFNALYLDRYLWDLHLGKQKIVQKAAANGAPLCGVTISAGIPDLAEATALLDELAAVGLWLNAFKPGTVDQVKRVLSIAKAAPAHTVFMHLEGGWAGGHHSWEDLEQLLLSTYHLVRAQSNVVLCVGGGIADEARSNALLTGRWASAHGLRPMPVDAVLLGTVTMACAEATASASVKQALADAAGADRWVHAGGAAGGVTSGKSQLNADIHYLDNAAARCGRLLDSVAGDAEAVAAQRDAIVAALDKTAKPFFGDVEAMTWEQVFTRMQTLTAIGRDGRYEDGVWPDISFRTRFAKLVWRAEARLASAGEVSLVQPDLNVLDSPEAVVAALVARYPAAQTETPHITDVTWFVRTLCTMRGKPVPFVPVIDQDVRRWFKSDSLWQAQDDRYDADQVLVIPGPAAVAGIARVDEPVAELLGRFDASLVAEQGQASAAPPVIASRRRPYAADANTLPAGLTQHVDRGRVILAAGDEAAPDAFFRYVGAHHDGPLVSVFVAERLIEIGATDGASAGRAIGNPVRRLVTAEPGAIVRLELDANDALTAIHVHPAEPWDDESVVLTSDEAGEVLVEARTRQVPGAPAAGPWRLFVKVQDAANGGACFVDATARTEGQRRFYHEQLFGRLLEATPLFETATRTATVEEDRMRAYAALSSARLGVDAAMPANMAFSLCWEALFATLSCPELIEGMPSLVHLDNGVELSAPLYAGDEVTVSARIERVETRREGQTISARCTVIRDGETCVVMRSRFFVREARGALGTQGRETWSADVAVTDAAARDFLLAHAWLEVNPGAEVAIGDVIRLEATLVTEQREGKTVFAARGTLARLNTAGGVDAIGSIILAETGHIDAHPLVALVGALGAHDAAATVETPCLTVGNGTGVTPSGLAAWADVSRDLNPIHTSRVFAALAGLGQPIVHGMWSAARLHAFVVDVAAAGRGSRITAFKAGFLAPALANEPLVFEAVRVSVQRGARIIEATASVVRDGQTIPVVRAMATVAPPTTAY